jgi:hypothetical protein
LLVCPSGAAFHLCCQLLIGLEVLTSFVHRGVINHVGQVDVALPQSALL